MILELRKIIKLMTLVLVLSFDSDFVVVDFGEREIE